MYTHLICLIGSREILITLVLSKEIRISAITTISLKSSGRAMVARLPQLSNVNDVIVHGSASTLGLGAFVVAS